MNDNPQQFVNAMNSDQAELIEALERLAIAAENRDNTMGDPCRLLQVKAELASAAKHANEVVQRAKGIKS